MTKFHSDDYIKFLRSIRPDNMSEYNKQMQRCKFTSYPLLKAEGYWFGVPPSGFSVYPSVFSIHPSFR